jgi:hypothetical protein
LHSRTLYILVALSLTVLVTAGSASAGPSSKTRRLVCDAWTPVPSPSPGSVSVLQDVADAGKDVAWAVGTTREEAGPVKTLIEQWDGSSWTVRPSPSPGDEENELRSIDALSPADAWAVGVFYSSDYDGEQPLVEHWDGTAWATVDVPAPWPAYFNDVDAISANDVWVVGTFNPPDDISFPLTEHWDGTAWTIVGAPLQDGPTVLTGVSAVSSTDIWAVGYTYTQDYFYPEHPVTEHWDGAAWSIAPSPSPGSTSELVDVDTVDADHAWAIGNSDAGFFGLRWDGVGWSLSPISQDLYTLEDLAATGPNTVWAVGWRYDINGASRASAVRRSFQGWRPTPGRSPAGTGFYGIDAVSPTRLWAVGFFGSRTLVEEFVSCRASPRRSGV